MQAIGHIKLLTVVAQHQARRKASALIAFWQRRDCLPFRQRAFLTVELVVGKRRSFFVNQPQARAVCGKDKVAWPLAL